MIGEVPQHPSDSFAAGRIVGTVEVQLKFREASNEKG